MRNSRIYLVLAAALILLLALAACPAKKDGGSTGSPGVTSGTDTGAAGTGKAGEPAAGTPSGGATSSAGDAGTANDTSGGSTANADAMLGNWFALFGRHDTGVAEPTFDNGHQIRLQAQGKGEIVMFAAGKPVTTLPLIWKDLGDSIQITYVPFDAIKSGLTRVAPLGIAEDEEIGLLKAGEAGTSSIDRDEEIGLVKGEDKGKDQGGKPSNSVTKVIKVKVENNYLSLTDQYSVMVYGRVLAPSEAQVQPEFSGKWTGNIDKHDNFPAVFTWDGKILTIKYEQNGGTFTGHLDHGYFIGQIKGGRGPARAALLLTTPSDLDGVYLADPYIEMSGRYSFNRAGE